MRELYVDPDCADNGFMMLALALWYWAWAASLYPDIPPRFIRWR